MTHFFYGSYAWLFVIGLLLLTALATEIGYTAGRRDQWVHPEGAKGQVTAITAGALGVLALLMAFTFAMAVSRFDVRKQLVLNEANAIGSTYLRARLLPAPHKTDIADLLRRYADVRLDFYRAADDRTLAKAIADTESLQVQLWSRADLLAEKYPSSNPVALFVQALNDTIDLHARRLVVQDDHVPPTVLAVLFLATIAAMALVGYGCGLFGRRNFVVTTLLTVIVAAVTFVILDLDRPRRGFLRVSQESMQNLQKELRRSAESGR